MIIRIFSTIIFVLGLVVSFKDYIMMFCIIKSRIQKEDAIMIRNKTYSLQGKTLGVVIVAVISSCVLCFTFLTIMFSWFNPDLQIFENLTSLLLPLNYSLELSKISTNTINKLITERLSIEDMKKFESADELKSVLKNNKQYLSKEEANELNMYFYNNKSLEWVNLNGFKYKTYQKELEKRNMK